MTLSIIIPVYKVEKYLRKCLDSCLHQNISKEDYEIICVNDGSPDNSAQILDEYAAKHPNIRVVTQTNQGLSMARNNGLAVAQGDYVWFIDSDDWIEENCLREIFDSILSFGGQEIDIVQIGYRNVYENENKPHIIHTPKWSGVISGIKYMNLPNLPTAVQFNIYRRMLLVDNNLTFYPGIYHEDIEFKPRALHYSSNCICHDTTVYNYLQRNNGNITASFKLKNGLDLITVIDSLCSFENKYVASTDEKSFFAKRIAVTINSIINGYCQLSKKDQKAIEEVFKTKRSIIGKTIKSNNPKYIIEGMILYLFPIFGLRFLAKVASL